MRPRLPNKLTPAYRMALLTCMAATLSGCAGFATLSESLFLMSPEKEIELGPSIRAEIEKDLTLVNDPIVTQYVGRMGQRIWNHSNKGPIPPRFHVVKDKELNAFAIPGGDIYIHSGLIDPAEDEAELAGVMSHELGHVIMRHGARHLSRATGAKLLEQILLGEDSGQATLLIVGVFEQGALSNFSRDEEQEADTVAVHTLHRMSYDPNGMRSFFAKLKAKYGDHGGPIGKLFASHPPTTARMEHVTLLIRGLPQRNYQRPVTELRRIQGRMDQIGLNE